MSILTDWSLLANFLVKGIVSCMLVAVIGVLISNIHPFHEPSDDE
jgi:hypothetical protein